MLRRHVLFVGKMKEAATKLENCNSLTGDLSRKHAMIMIQISSTGKVLPWILIRQAIGMFSSFGCLWMKQIKIKHTNRQEHVNMKNITRVGWLGWTIDRKKLLAPKKRWTPSPSADVTVSTKTCWRFQGRQFPKTAWPASLQTTHASGFGFLYLFSFVGTVSQGITAGHCAGSGKKVCNLDFEKGASWFIVRFLSSFGIPDLSW